MSEYENPLDDKTRETFDRVLQERGLGDADSFEDLTGDDLEAFIAVDPQFLVEFIAIYTQARREEDVVDPATGRYNDPCLQRFDRVLAKLGYVYDKKAQGYVQRDPANIVIPELSRTGMEQARALPTEESTY